MTFPKLAEFEGFIRNLREAWGDEAVIEFTKNRTIVVDTGTHFGVYSFSDVGLSAQELAFSKHERRQRTNG